MRTFKVLGVLTILLLSGLTVLAPASAAPEPTATTTRTVLIEMFTGAACPPCVNPDHALDDMGDDYTRGELTILVYHRSIPAADILETTETSARHSWYITPGNGASTPNMWVDGIIVRAGGFSTQQDGYNWFTTQYNTRVAKDSQLDIEVDGTISQGKNGQVWVNVTKLEEPSLSNLYLHVVVYRKEYGPYNGGNGIQQHRYVVRDMLTGAQGASFDFSTGDTQSFDYQFDLSSDQYSAAADMGVVAFVQTGTKKADGSTPTRQVAEVLQSADATLRVTANKVPVLSNGGVDKVNVTEDDYVTFGVNYSDGDNFAPAESKIILQNGTANPYDHGLDPKLGDWINGRRLEYTAQLKPGQYRFKFFARDAFVDAVGDIDWNPVQVTVRTRNKLPELDEYSYAPYEGDTRTEFRFDIMYRDLDNEPPAVAQIYINGVANDMVTDSTGPWNDWVTYYYETTLPPGDDHRFYYVFSDGQAQVRHPLVTMSPNWIRGPEVLPPNEAPSLTTELFTPAAGTRATNFAFSVIYTDGENDYPSMSYIYLDGVPQLMMGLGSNFVNGVKFEYTTRLALGAHSYYYVFNDGRGHEARHPVAGTFEGPTVTNLGPTADISSPATGTRYTPTDFVPFSAVDSSDPEGDALTFAWASDIDGDLEVLDAFDMRLSEGWHNITLTVTDAYGASATAALVLEVRPYRAHAMIKVLAVSDDRPLEKDPVRITVTVGNDGEAIAEGLDVTILVDGTEVYSSTVSVPIAANREVGYTWVSVAGTHVLRAEIQGDYEETDILVDPNAVPDLDPVVYNVGGTVAKYTPGDEVFFRANADDPNGDDITFEWNFGDGTAKSMERNPSHVYTAAGTYTVTLKVTDAREGTMTKSFDVVIDKPKVDEPGFGAALAALAILGAIGASAAVGRRRP